MPFCACVCPYACALVKTRLKGVVLDFVEYPTGYSILFLLREGKEG